MPDLVTLIALVLAFGASVNLYRVAAGLGQIGHSLIQIARDVEMIRVVEENRADRERREHESLLATDPRTWTPERKKRS